MTINLEPEMSEHYEQIKKEIDAAAAANADQLYQQIAAEGYRNGYADCMRNLPPQMR